MFTTWLLWALLCATTVCIDITVWLPQKNIDKLERIVADISNPQSPNYGNYLSKAKLTALIGNTVAVEHVKQFMLSTWNATAVEVSELNDKLYCYGIDSHNINYFDGEHWESGVSIPPQLEGSIDAIAVLKHNRGAAKWGFAHTPTNKPSSPDAQDGSPSNLRAAFGIPHSMKGSSKTRQMVWGPGTYGVLKTDVEKYIKQFFVPETIDVLHQVGYKGKVGGDNFGEATLDTEVITGVGVGVPTYVYNSNNTQPTEEGPGFGWAYMDFLNLISAMSDVERPNVLSLSLGSLSFESCNFLCNELAKQSNGKYTKKACLHYLQYENRQVCQFSNDYVVARANVEMMKLGSMGVTIVAAAGDGGCHYSYHPYSGLHIEMDTLLNKISCANVFPVFPCASPYATCVGGTSWEQGGPEGAVLWRGGGSGFSRNFAMPEWQKKTVQHYITSNNGTSQFATWGSYNYSARAYPDVSALGVDVPIVFIGGTSYAGGTSASTPAVGGFFSLVNEHRLSKGKPVLGLANPLIYQLGEKNTGAFHDITSGNSRYPSGGEPCATGFTAVKGWDAATGWGRPLWDGFTSA